MGLSSFARTRAIRFIFAGDLMVGLTHGEEIEDDGYARQPVRFEPEGEATVINVTEARFGPWQKTSSVPTGWVVFDDQGRELAAGDLIERADAITEIRRGDELVLRAGKLIAGLD